MVSIFPVKKSDCGSNLKQMCLDCIVNNFDRFMLAYDDQKSIPHKYFEFLQRVLSKELLQKLIEKDKDRVIEDRYFSFLINPHLKELNLSSCHSKPEPILERLEEVGQNITLLSLNKKEWSVEMLQNFVKTVPNVETLLLQSTECDDTVLKVIEEQCKSLVKLDVSYCSSISEKGIEALLGKHEPTDDLKENTVLQYLDIISINIPNSSIMLLLKYAPMLRTLSNDHVAFVIYELHATDFVNGHIDFLPKYQLTSLYFFPFSSYHRYSTQPLADVVQVCSAFCPYVTSIKIDCDLNGSILAACSKFEDLKDATLNNMSNEIAPPAWLSSFVEARGSKLHKLDLKNFVIPLQAFSNYCKKLHTLTLFATEFSNNEKLTGKDCFPHMRELSIEDPNFAQESVSRSVMHLVSNSPKLEILSLRHGSSFTMDIVRQLTRCKCISYVRCIDVSYSDINATSILELMTAARRLDRFHMELVNVSEKEFQELEDRSLVQRFVLYWRDENIYSSDNDDDISEYSPYEFEDYYDDYDNYDSEYNSDDGFYPYPV